MSLRKRIEAVEQIYGERRRIKDCICLVGARFHTSEEADGAFQIPCPIHGKPRFKFCMITLPISEPLHPADRHLCHCPPMLRRQAAEEGRTLTEEEEQLAHEQEHAWWEELARPWREQLERECLERAAARRNQSKESN